MRHRRFRKPLIFCVCGIRTINGSTLHQLNVELPHMIGSEIKPAKPQGEQSPAPTGLVVLLFLFRCLL
jgi:hypothetical protein